MMILFFFFFSSRRRHTRFQCDWSSDVCSSDLVTVVAPNGNVAPLAGVQLVATGPSSVSVADAVKLKTAPVALVASTVAFAGTVRTGPVVSLTVTVKVLVATLA